MTGSDEGHDITVIPIAWIKVACFAVALILVGVFFLGRSSAPTPPALPAKVQATVTRHTITSVVDTVETNRILRQADAARRREAAAAKAQQLAEDAAALARHVADSLALEASAAASARDSAEAWHAAYGARSTEADSLRGSVIQQSARLQAVSAQLAFSDSVGSVWHIHALRGDSIITQLVPLAQQADRCRILYVIHCPSRTKAAIAGGIIGSVATAVALSRK